MLINTNKTNNFDDLIVQNCFEKSIKHRIDDLVKQEIVCYFKEKQNEIKETIQSRCNITLADIFNKEK